MGELVQQGPALLDGASDEDERDTLRAPPKREDETPRVVRLLGSEQRTVPGVLPSPQLLPPPPAEALRTAPGLLSAVVVPPPAGEASLPPLLPTPEGALVATAPELLPPPPKEAVTAPVAPPPPPLPTPASKAERPRASPPPLPRRAQPIDTVPIPGQAADAREVDEDEDTRKFTLSQPPIVEEIAIPPLRVSRELAVLAGTSKGASEPAPAQLDLALRAPESTLSPKERAPQREARPRRVLPWLALAAVVLLGFGVNALSGLRPRPTAGASQAAAASERPRPSAEPARPKNVPAPVATPAPLPERALPADVAPPSLPPQVVRRPRRAPAIDPATLADEPSRDQVVAAMTPLRAAIVRCSAGGGGVAELVLSIAGSGAVLHATVVGDYAGTPAGSCMARAAREARFDPFRTPRFTVRYPMALAGSVPKNATPP